MKVTINPAYSSLTEFINHLPEIFETQGEEIYKGRNTIKRYVIDGVDLVVKSFREPILVNRFAYTYLRHSKARRSYEYSFELLRRGILTPDPIAYVETYSGTLIKNSYFVSLNISSGDTLRDMGLGISYSEELLKALAGYLVTIHNAGVYHIDLSPGNILYERDRNGNYSFYLIDINRMKFSDYLDMKNRAHNFERLAMSEEVSTKLAEYYSLVAGYPTAEFVSLVNSFSDGFFYSRTLKQVVRKYRHDHSVIRSVLAGPLTRHLSLRAVKTFIPGSSASKIDDKCQKLYERYFREEDCRGGMARMFGYKK